MKKFFVAGALCSLVVSGFCATGDGGKDAKANFAGPSKEMVEKFKALDAQFAAIETELAKVSDPSTKAVLQKLYDYFEAKHNLEKEMRGRMKPFGEKKSDAEVDKATAPKDIKDKKETEKKPKDAAKSEKTKVDKKGDKVEKKNTEKPEASIKDDEPKSSEVAEKDSTSEKGTSKVDKKSEKKLKGASDKPMVKTKVKEKVKASKADKKSKKGGVSKKDTKKDDASADE